MFADDVVESSEVTTGITKIGDYELRDLVLLEYVSVFSRIKQLLFSMPFSVLHVLIIWCSNNSFGVIIRVESEAFQVSFLTSRAKL